MSGNTYADKGYLENFNEFILDNSKYLSEHDIKGLKLKIDNQIMNGKVESLKGCRIEYV